MGVASLVLGIVGLVLSFVPCFGVFAMFLTIPGVILGAIAVVLDCKKNAPKGIAIGGLVCSIIGTVVAIFWYYAVTSGADAAAKGIEDLDREVSKAFEEASEEISNDWDRELNEAIERVSKER